MKALIATRYGGPEVLSIADRPEPEVAEHDVLIAVKAASLNPLDYKIRDGKVKLLLKLKPPIALGCDVAGVVERVGAKVTAFAVGDQVYARLEKDRMGGLAERVAAVQQVVAKKPTRASFEQAAALPLAALTALQALRDVARLKPGLHEARALAERSRCGFRLARRRLRAGVDRRGETRRCGCRCRRHARSSLCARPAAHAATPRDLARDHAATPGCRTRGCSVRLFVHAS
jgi:hypothetical protein